MTLFQFGGAVARSHIARVSGLVAAILIIPVAVPSLLAVKCAAVLPTKWASSLTPTDIEYYLNHVTSLPPEYGRAVYQLASLKQKRSIWKGAVATVRADYPSHLAKTADRESFLDRVSAEVDEVFKSDGAPTPALVGSLRSLKDQMVTLFDLTTAVALFDGAGKLPNHDSSALPFLQRLSHARGHLPRSLPSSLTEFAARWTSTVTLHASTPPACYCSVEWNCIEPPNYNATCRVPDSGCDPSSAGCGPFWVLQCDGFCFG